MTTLKNNLIFLKTMIANKQIIKLNPSMNWFLTQYMAKFNLINVDEKLIMHSHLPALNSRAFTRFIDEHLLNKTPGPSHAQISLTNACPQQCQYCYNKNRSGKLLSTDEIKKTIAELKSMGVFWLGFTGGEPLLNRDIVEIVKSAGNDCALKLFTTGVNLTEPLAAKLKQAGLDYVSISLDHWLEEEHDKIRGSQGAFNTAISAIEVFKQAGLHVSVSAVISKEMLKQNQVKNLMDFLISLKVHEAWLSETKPTVEAFWNQDAVITEAERLSLVKLQDEYNKKSEITVNYLGHFEGKEQFGCNAGHKMVYIDAFGEVSPCVFAPLAFGNIRDESIGDIFDEMKKYFPSESNCFINNNYELLRKHSQGDIPLNKNKSKAMMQEVQFSPLSKFGSLYNKL